MERYSEPVPVSEAMKTDPELKMVVEKIMKGELDLCSPFPGMNEPWSESDKAALSAALRRFGWA